MPEIKNQDGVAVVNHQDEDSVYVSVILLDEKGKDIYSMVALDKKLFRPY